MTAGSPARTFLGPLAGALSLSTLVLALACGRGNDLAPTPTTPPAGDIVAPSRSVLFVGLDGADWQFLEPLMAAGRMPNLARLVSAGSGGVLVTEQPPLSPLLWTTMMTGRGPLEHRILDFVRFHAETGRREPITSDERQVPAVWNIASEAGREVAVIGLWATFPAEEAKGLLVSNVFLSARESVERALSPASEKSWAERVRQEGTGSVDLAAMRRLLPDLSADELAAAVSSSDPFAEKVPGLRQVLVQTEIVRRLALEWLAKHPTRLAAVYFEGTDTIGHLFAPFVAPQTAGVDARDAARFGPVPERYFELLDGVLGELAEVAARSGAVLMLASDHGFEWGEGRPAGLSSVAGATAAKWHRSDGIYLLVGPGIPARPGRSARGGVAQVASTLLALIDLPAPRGVAPALAEAGPAPLPAADSRLEARLPVADSRPEVHFSHDEELRKLQALGYLGAGPEKSEGPRPHGTRTAGSFSNEAQILEGLGRTAEAMLCYEQALEQEPGDVAAKWNLSNLLFEEERDAVRSDRLLVEAFQGGLPAGGELIVARAALWRERGRLDRARALLDAAVAGRPAHVALRLFRGRARIEQGDCGGAAADFAEAVRRDEARAGSWAALATAHLCLGDRAAARRAFERAVALAPEREELRRALTSLDAIDEPRPRR